jgi:hypothetical protein
MFSGRARPARPDQALACCWWTTRFCTSVSSMPKACS